jgi:hypothetical protein
VCVCVCVRVCVEVDLDDTQAQMWSVKRRPWSHVAHTQLRGKVMRARMSNTQTLTLSRGAMWLTHNQEVRF